MDKRIMIAIQIYQYEQDKIISNMHLIKKGTLLTTPTLSKTMKGMKKGKLITRTREGRNVNYSLTSKGKRWVVALLEVDKIFKTFGGMCDEKNIK